MVGTDSEEVTGIKVVVGTEGSGRWEEGVGNDRRVAFKLECTDIGKR